MTQTCQTHSCLGTFAVAVRPGRSPRVSDLCVAGFFSLLGLSMLVTTSEKPSVTTYLKAAAQASLVSLSSSFLVIIHLWPLELSLAWGRERSIVFVKRVTEEAACPPRNLQFSGGHASVLWDERSHEGMGQGRQGSPWGAGETSWRRAGWAGESWESVKETGGGKHQR